MRTMWGCLALGLAACDSERLSAQEARETFEAVNEVTNEVIWCARDTIEQGSRTQLDVERDGDTLAIVGRVTPPDQGTVSGWTGAVTLDGQVIEDDERLAYSLEVDCDNVTIGEGPTLDGLLDLVFFVDDPSAASDLLWSLGVEIDGALDLSGTAVGHAALDYDLALKIDGFSIAFEASGTINGYDVSGWSYAFSL